MDVQDYPSLGPGHREHDGKNLIIKSTGDNITATLTDNIYIKGDEAYLILGGGQHFYLDLNYHTIYVEGCSHNLSTPNKNALKIPPNTVTITGSGAIIVEGNIDFWPNMEAGSEEDFVFVLSLYGRINFQPNGTLYGSVAAHEVEVGPGNVLYHTNSPTDPDTGEQVMDFPLDAVASTVEIFTWEINP